jgi:periplasmic divalent cation tolerance protein
MMQNNDSVRIVLTTAANLEEANRLGRILVEERLAACATLVPAVKSIYAWKGKIETSSEAMLLLKTGKDQLAVLEARLQELHSYETPEFLVLAVEGGSRAYFSWMFEVLGLGSDARRGRDES